MSRWVFSVWWLMLVLPCEAQRQGDGADDYLQYAPYAAVAALKACGVESQNDWPQLVVSAVGSWAVTAGITYAGKHTVREWRPDHSDRRSFPSGHAAFAFAGATALRHEYGHTSSWIPVAGYAVATLTAADRVRRDRHHWYDVAAGAAVGALSTELTYYIGRRLTDNRQLSATVSPAGINLAYNW